MQIAQQQKLMQPQLDELQQRTQLLKVQRSQAEMILQNDQSTQAFARTIKDPAEQAKYLQDPKGWFADREIEGSKPANLLYLKNSGMGNDDVLKQLPAKELYDLTKQVAAEHAKGLNPTMVLGANGYDVVSMGADGKPKVVSTGIAKPAPEANFQMGPLGNGNVGIFDTHTGQLRDSGVKGMMKGGKLEASTDGYFHMIGPDGSDIKTDVLAPPKTAGTKTIAAEDGFYHQILPDGSDRKTDVRIPKKETADNATIARTIKSLTPSGYQVKDIGTDDTVTLTYPGVGGFMHPDMQVVVPGAKALYDTHASTGAGSAEPSIPEGAVYLRDDKGVARGYRMPDGHDYRLGEAPTSAK